MEAGCPPIGTSSNLSIPRELIAIRAYLKWKRRCEGSGHMVHGMDVRDWLDAENEIRRLWNGVSPGDLVRFAQDLDTRMLAPSPEHVRMRAYYKSLQDGAATPEQIERFWLDAEREERELAFAETFLGWLASKRA
jgi:hypothetical protein